MEDLRNSEQSIQEETLQTIAEVSAKASKDAIEEVHQRAVAIDDFFKPFDMSRFISNIDKNNREQAKYLEKALSSQLKVTHTPDSTFKAYSSSSYNNESTV